MRYRKSQKSKFPVTFLLASGIALAGPDVQRKENFTPPSISATPYSKEKILSENHSVSWMDFSLKTCLEINYEKLGAYKSQELKDYTSVHPAISPQQSIALVKYIGEEAGDYYTENLPIDSELTPPPYNAIFARCMNFYKSKDLKKFIHKLQSTKQVTDEQEISDHSLRDEAP